MRAKLVHDERGVPIFVEDEEVDLAEVRPAGIARLDPNTKSGNDAHDIRSGKFAPKAGSAKRGPTPPPNVDRAAYGRMLDAVRDAARSFAGALTPENIQSFIAKRAANPEAVNIQAFLQAAHTQQLADIVDILQPNAKGPKLSAPRGYVQKVLAGATDDDVSEIIARIAARSGDEQKAAKLVIGKIPKERREAAEAAVAATDFSADWDGVELSDDGTQESASGIDPVELTEAIARAFPKQEPPVIHLAPVIEVNAPPAQSVRKEIIRNEAGLAIGVVEIPEGQE